MAVDMVGVLPVFLTGALAVQLRADVGLALDSLGLVYASYFLAAAVLSAPLGRVCERFGPGPALRTGTLVYVAAFVGIATLVSSPPALSGFILLAGLGTSLTRTASSVLVARHVHPGRQGLAFGLKHCSIPVASVLSGLSVPAIALTIGWRWAYAVAALLTLAVLATIPRANETQPERHDHADGDMPIRVLAIAAVGFGLGSAAAASLGAYTVSTAVSAGLSEGAAGVLVAMGSVVGLASRLLVGHWSDRRTGSQLDLVTWMLVLGAGGFLLLGLADEVFVWIAVPVAFATGWAWLGSYNLAMVRLNPVAPGAAVGFTQTGAFVGAIFGPATLGLVADRVSFTAAWMVAAGLSFAAAGIIVLVRRFVVRAAGEPGTRVLSDTPAC